MNILQRIGSTVFRSLLLGTSLWAGAASAQGFVQADQAEQWITMTRKNYTARDLHLAGPVKRVVQYDSINVQQAIPPATLPIDSATIDVIPVTTVHDTSIWEFDSEGNVLSELKQGVLTRYHRDREGRIDSIIAISVDAADSYIHKRFDVYGRFVGADAVGVVDGKAIGEIHVQVHRKTNGNVNSVIINQGEEQILHVVPMPKRKDGLHATKLGAHDKDGDYSIEYLTDANGRLRDIQMTVAMKVEDKLRMQNSVTFDSTGNILRKEMKMLGSQFVQTYEYGTHGEMTSYRNSAHALGDASAAVTTTLRYKYTYDAHGNWTLRTIDGQSPEDTEAAAGSSELIPHIERQITYW